jgi:hypothetical protein
VSNNPCVVTIFVPSDGDTVWIRLLGEVEMGAETVLDRAADRVRHVAPDIVAIDLCGVTFAGSELVHFLLRVHAGAPRAPIRLHQAKPMIRTVVTAAGVDAFVTLDEHRSPLAT